MSQHLDDPPRVTWYDRIQRWAVELLVLTLIMANITGLVLTVTVRNLTQGQDDQGKATAATRCVAAKVGAELGAIIASLQASPTADSDGDGITDKTEAFDEAKRIAHELRTGKGCGT